jgi:hypothetical protein
MGMEERKMRQFSNTKPLSILIVTLFAVFVGAMSTPANAVTPRDFGGKGDVITLRDGAITQATTAFRSSSAAFTSADVGKAMVVSGAGNGGGALVTKIQGFVSGKQVTLADSASANVVGALTYYGTDDTAAIRSCVYQGTTKGGECTIGDDLTFMVSNTKSTIAPIDAGNNPIRRGAINGHGKLIFAPQGTLTGGTNDRFLYVTSREGHPSPIAGPIQKGATSFRVKDPSAAAALSAGDWVIVTEMDSVAGDVVYVDWMEVSAVEGDVISTAKPFRMAFPNARPYEGPPKHFGLTFRKVGPITSNITIRDITIIIPEIVQEKHGLVGIAARDTLGTVISNVSCQDASGNCFAGYMDKGLIFVDNDVNGTVYSEFAAQVDANISRNHVSEPNKELSLPGPPTTGGLEVDFGTAFSAVEGNISGPTRQVCLMLLPGVHDTVVSGNTCDLVTFGSGAACILARGGYRLTITKNVCKGATGAGKGIDVGDATNLRAPILSDGNVVLNNRVQGFPTPYSCEVGRLRTDKCDYGR